VIYFVRATTPDATHDRTGIELAVLEHPTPQKVAALRECGYELVREAGFHAAWAERDRRLLVQLRAKLVAQAARRAIYDAPPAQPAAPQPAQKPQGVLPPPPAPQGGS
jgi:hypothetical protein